MKKNTVLVYAPGWPLRAEAFLPKERLAAQAGEWVAAGQDVHILDFGTPQYLDCFETIVPSGAFPTWSWLQQRTTERIFTARRNGWLTDRTAEIIALRPDSIIYLADTREEFSEAHALAIRVQSQRTGVVQGVIGRHVRRHGAALVRTAPVFWPTGANALPALPQREKDAAWIASACYAPSIYPALYQGGKFHLFPVRVSDVDSQPAHGCDLIQEDQLRDPRAVCDEVRHIQGLAPTQTVCFAGTVSGRHLAAVAAEVQAQRLELTYAASVIPSAAVQTALPGLTATGCLTLDVLAPTGSQRLLEDVFGCPFSVSQVRGLLREVRAHGVATSVALVYPGPWDDRHTCAEIMLLMDQTLPEGVVLQYPEWSPISRWHGVSERFDFRVNSVQYGRWAAGAPLLSRNAPFAPPWEAKGWSQDRLIAAQTSLAQELATRGITPGLCAWQALAARTAGFEHREAAWFQRFQTALQTVDLAELSAFITGFNRCAGRAATSRRAPAEGWNPYDLAAAAN